MALTGALLSGLSVTGALAFGIASQGSTRQLLEACAAMVLAPGLIWLFANPRLGVGVALVVIYLGCVDGALKLATGSAVATLGRDLVIYAVALGALVRLIASRRALKLPPRSGLILAWYAVVLMQVANPGGVSLTHSLVSVRPDLEFVPLFFLAYGALRTERTLWGFLLLLVGIGAANGIVTLLQSGLSTSQLASWGPGYRALAFGSSTGQVAQIFRAASGAVVIRPPGLGGFEGFGGAVGVYALPAAIALLTRVGASRLLRVALVGAAVISLIAVLLSQARTSLLGAVIVLFLYGFGTVTSKRGVRSLVVMLAAVVVGVVLFSVVVPKSEDRYAGAAGTTSGSIAPAHLLSTIGQNFSTHGTLSVAPSYVVKYPLGAGLGRVGSASVSGIGGNETGNLSGESEFTYLLVETGVPGLLVLLFLQIATVRTLWSMRRVKRQSLQRPLVVLAVLSGYLAVTWFIGGVSAASPAAPLFWATAGAAAYWGGQMKGGHLELSGRLRVR